VTDVDSDLSDGSAYLIWEEAEKTTWWLARGHDGTATFVIAPDLLTGHMLVLMQTTEDSAFKVIAAVSKRQAADRATALAEAKRMAVRWLSNNDDQTVKASVRAWRTQRWSFIAVREVPLAALALAVGGFLAFVIASFFILTGLTGWVMIVVGVLMGALAGWILKWLADLKFASVLGPAGRFYSVTGSAVIGSVGTMVVFFVLFAAG
jgi:hypothetical protein